MKTPNSKPPIHRASRTCETSASSALPTRTKKTFPATSCASLLSPPSAITGFSRARMRAPKDAVAVFVFSELTRATGFLRARCRGAARDGWAIELAYQGTVKNRLDAAVSGHFQLGDIREDARHRFTFGRPERGLRRQGIADGIALDLQAGLDAGGKVEAGKGLVDAPQIALKFHRLGPLSEIGSATRRETGQVA